VTSNSQRPRDEIAVLHKAIDLLECLVEAPLTAGEISKQIGMAKPTVYRIIRTLQTRGLVAREIDGSRYMLGTAVYALGSAHRSADLVSLARPAMVRLASEFGETVNLAIPVHNEVVYIDVIESMHQLRTQVPAGFRDHLHSTALGKAILAALADNEVRAILASADRVAKTPNTVVAVPALLRQLATVRERGFAIDDEENELGSICVASAFLNHTGRAIGAVSVSGPRWRIGNELAEVIGAELVAATHLLSAALRNPEPTAGRSLTETGDEDA
jgi:IclR family transcriptional regulator, acetate operon repressor